MAMAAGGPNGGGGKVVSLRLQYYCVFAAVGVAVIVLSLTLLSPSAMGAVRQNLGAVVANSGQGEREARQAVAAVVAKPEPEKVEEKEDKKAGPPVVLFNFGDSNSDTGGRIAAGFEPMSPPYGSTFFGGPSGRFCDGRLILDFLMDAMDMPFLNSYLDSVGAPNFRAGVNFAQAGCSITPATATSVSPFSFGLQIKQFFAFKEKVTRLLSKGDRYRHYIPQLDYFSKGLYMFDIGQNDLAGAFYSKTEDQVIASIPTILLELETGLKTLYEQGARKFWIHNTGPLGCLPQNIALWGKDPSQLDEQHCVAKHNRAAKIFNLQLHALCTKLRGQFAGSDITYIDIYSIKYSLVAN